MRRRSLVGDGGGSQSKKEDLACKITGRTDINIEERPVKKGKIRKLH